MRSKRILSDPGRSLSGSWRENVRSQGFSGPLVLLRGGVATGQSVEWDTGLAILHGHVQWSCRCDAARRFL